MLAKYEQREMINGQELLGAKKKKKKVTESHDHPNPERPYVRYIINRA